MDPIIQDISKQTEIPVSEISAAPTRHPFHKTPIFLMGLFVILIIGAFFAGTYYQGMSTKNETLMLAVVSPSPVIASPTPDPTARWKTYTNIQYGYSLRYPPEWKLNIESPTTASLSINEPARKSDPNAAMQDYITPPDPETFAQINISYAGEKDKEPEQVAKEWRGSSGTQVTVDGHTGAETTSGAPVEGEQIVSGGKSISVFVKNDQKENLLIQLETANMEMYQPIFDQILKTFKFLDSAQPTDTSAWKTYTNSKYGFSLKYPATGQVRDSSCLGEASCPKHVGACGLDIQELYSENPPEITFDNFFAIRIRPFSGSITQYMKQRGAEEKYDTEVVQVSGADEALKLKGIKQGVTFEGYDPLNNTSYLVKKGTNIFDIVGFQDIASKGCLPEVSAPLPADGVPSWDIPGSFFFTR